MKSTNSVLLALCYEKVPNYIVSNDRNNLEIDVNLYQGKQIANITIENVIEYYATQANNTDSQTRELAGIVGHWQNIDNIAREALDYFRAVNMDEVKKEANKRKLAPIT